MQTILTLVLAWLIFPFLAVGCAYMAQEAYRRGWWE